MQLKLISPLGLVACLMLGCAIAPQVFAGAPASKKPNAAGAKAGAATTPQYDIVHRCEAQSKIVTMIVKLKLARIPMESVIASTKDGWRDSPDLMANINLITAIYSLEEPWSAEEAFNRVFAACIKEAAKTHEKK